MELLKSLFAHQTKTCTNLERSILFQISHHLAHLVHILIAQSLTGTNKRVSLYSLTLIHLGTRKNFIIVQERINIAFAVVVSRLGAPLAVFAAFTALCVDYRTHLEDFADHFGGYLFCCGKQFLFVGRKIQILCLLHGYLTT